MKEENIVSHDAHLKIKIQIKLWNRNTFANMLTCISLAIKKFFGLFTILKMSFRLKTNIAQFTTLPVPLPREN